MSIDILEICNVGLQRQMKQCTDSCAQNNFMLCTFFVHSRKHSPHHRIGLGKQGKQGIAEMEKLSTGNHSSARGALP